MFENKKGESILIKAPLIVGAIFVCATIITILWVLSAFAVEYFLGEKNNISNYHSRSEDIKEYYETPSCKSTYKGPEIDPFSPEPKKFSYYCEIKINEPIYVFCVTNAYTKRCPWRSGFLVLNKLLDNGLMLSSNGSCKNKIFEYDKDAFIGKQITIESKCNDYIYYSITPIKEGRYSIVLNEAATLDIQITK